MAGTIIVPGLSLSAKTPKIYIAVIFGGPGTSAGIAQSKTLLFGNKIEANITATIGTITYTTTLGSATTEVVTQVNSETDARTKFGAGSELQCMASAFLKQYPTGLLYAIPVALAGGGSVGSMTITFATTASASGGLRLYAAGRTYDVAVASGDTPTVIAANCAHAINQDPTTPVYAEVAVGVLTIKSKQKSARANDIRVYITVISGQTEIVATTGGATLWGTSVTPSAYVLSGGAGADTVATALTAVSNTRYHRYCAAQSDATNLGRFKTQLDSMASSTSMKWQQLVVCSVDTAANANNLAFKQSDGTGVNHERTQIVWHYRSAILGAEVAAYVCAARLNGDASVGGSLPGEDADAACNHDGVRLPYVPPQFDPADRPSDTQIETALNNGITPLAPTGSGTYIVRSITTRCADPIALTFNYSVIDTEIVTVCDFEAEKLATNLQTITRGAKLAPDSADGSAPKTDGVITPSMAKGFVLSELKESEAEARIVNVDARADSLQAIIDPNRRGFLLMEVPVEPIQLLHGVGANVRQQG